MDQMITSSYSDSSSSSSYEQKQQQHPQNTIKSSKSSYHTSLHSVRKPLPLGKPIPKHFIAPLPPTPLKIYNVERSKFKQVVRVLTSTPEFQYPSASRLKDKAPPPLVISAVPKPFLFPKSTPLPPPPLPLDGGGVMSPLSTFLMSPDFCNLLNETMHTGGFSSSTTPGMDYFEDFSTKAVGHDPSSGAVMSPRGFISLSPTSLSWCSSVLFGPGTGTLSAVNHSTLL
ncbi:hypothetical protein L1987_66168 [Smallanthus sonchifolius]|uniref:Uncharacterized protein n=1 Tax=Smallanthus sonchifolius TaxID=185202 RepID=A0ACB9BWJ4_9ASTR|nr:hypothetical protein L1987_66168 [Smallanthus sonchifolius]